MTDSAYLLARRIEADVVKALADAEMLEPGQDIRRQMRELKRTAGDARLDVRDYEFAETRDEQAKNAKAARERLAAVRDGILAASQHDIFSAVDVARLSATIDQLLEQVV